MRFLETPLYVWLLGIYQKSRPHGGSVSNYRYKLRKAVGVEGRKLIGYRMERIDERNRKNSNKYKFWLSFEFHVFESVIGARALAS